MEPHMIVAIHNCPLTNNFNESYDTILHHISQEEI